MYKLNYKLKPFQENAINYLSKNNVNGLLLVHPTGSGKTVTAIAYAKKFLTKYKENKVIFVGPVSVLNDVKKTINNMYDEEDENKNKYDLYSYQKFKTEFEAGQIYCSGNLLIIDEAHNLKNLNKGGERAKSIFKCASYAKKRLLLTATPFTNELEDLNVLVNFIYGAPLIHTKSQVRVIEDLYKYLKNKVSYLPLTQNRGKDFPTSSEHIIKIKMPESYEKEYCKLIKGESVNNLIFLKPYAFYNAHRRAVNKIGRSEEYFSLKIKKVIELVNNYSKTIIYTNWLDFGVKPLSKALKENKINFLVYEGSLSEDKRAYITDEYNNNKVNVLIITASGKESINLFATRCLIIMDPVWNYSGIQQIEGRAIRYRSHANLPLEERHVDIYYLLLTTGKKKCISGDEIVYKFINEKRRMHNVVNNLLSKSSI